jgi:electron transfer flavoprotein beta subunit
MSGGLPRPLECLQFICIPIAERFSTGGVILHVVVVTKSAPDKEAKIEISGGAVKVNSELFINYWDEYSVTEALNLKDSHSVKTTVLTVGPEVHAEALKDALARGIDEAVRVWDDSMEGQDSLGYSRTLAAAIQKLGDVDLVIFGKEFFDYSTDTHIFQVGRLLGWPTVGSYLKIVEIDFNAKTMTIEKLVEEGKETLKTTLPAVIGIAQDINEPRNKTFPGIKRAARTVIPVWTAADLGISTDQPNVKTTEYRAIPVHEGSVELIDGSSDEEKAEKLIARLIEEKIL